MGGGLEGILRDSRVLICAGAGGVGKTTVAAAMGVAAAGLGLRVCVVTIDPAKRLADALGVEELGNTPVKVDSGSDGELWAMMLDTKQTFDGLVSQYAASPQQAQRILDNHFYRNISGALSGTQEYMAVEKLNELQASGRFDLVVVDTPPSRRALDFLDAPRRLMRFLDNRVFRLLMLPTRAGLKAVNVAAQLFLRSLSKVVGGAVVTDAVEFFSAFEGMERGFRERSKSIERLLVEPSTGFVVVSAPRSAAVEESEFFITKLEEADLRVVALVVNRVFPRFPVSLTGDPTTPQELAIAANLADFQHLAAREDEHIGRLQSRLVSVPSVKVPFFAREIHDRDSLTEVGTYLLGG